MGKRKNLSDFDKGLILMAGRLDQTISKPTRTTHLNTTTVMAVAFLSRIKLRVVQEWFKEDDKEFKVLPWPQNSPDLSLIQHLWDVLEKQDWSMEDPLKGHNANAIRGLCQSLCLDGSELFW